MYEESLPPTWAEVQGLVATSRSYTPHLYSAVQYSALQYSTVPDGVHDDIEQVRVKVWGLQVGTILVGVHLET